MPIDPSIALQVQAPQNPLAQFAQVAQIQGLQNQNRLADLQFTQAERQAQRQNKLTELLSGGADEEALRRAGFLEESSKLGKDRRENLKLDNESMKAKREAEAAQFKLAHDKAMGFVNLVASAKDEPSYMQALQQAGSMGIDVSKAPQQFDPAFVANAAQQALTVKERIEAAARERGLDLTQRGQDMTDKRTREEGAANRSVTMRGQNMTNERAKEANGIMRDLNIQEKKLKIDELASEKATRDQAKEGARVAADVQIAAIDKALQHPGRATGTGLSGAIDPRNYIPGTQATDFRVVLDQIKGTAFLQAFQSLKGGGAITEMEGKKAEAAIARLDRAQSDKEFEGALRELRSVMVAGKNRLAGRNDGASGGVSGAAQPSAEGRVIDFGDLK